MFKMTKEIQNKEGEIHFRRWAIFECRFFNIYIHRIYKHDEDNDPHNHPWRFWSWILKGGYVEEVKNTKDYGSNQGRGTRVYYRNLWNIAYRNFHQFHKITRLSHREPVTTLVLTGPRRDDPWGYWCKIRKKMSWKCGNYAFLNFEDYRRQKRAVEAGDIHYDCE